MEYVPLGRTDLLVSRIALGCMGFADPAQGVHHWALDEQAAAPIFRRAVELNRCAGLPASGLVSRSPG